MESVLAGDLGPGVRLDESLHLPGGELVLCRGQAADAVLLEALAACGVSELVACAGPGDAEAAALQAGRQPASLEDIAAGASFPWGLYEANGRKLLRPGRRLEPHLRSALRSGGVDVVFEPSSDQAARLARRKRLITKRRSARRGRSGGSDVAWPLLDPSGALGRLPLVDADAGDTPAPPPVAEAILAHAVMASEVESVTTGLAMGLSLDTPRALEVARSAVKGVFASPFVPVACGIDALSSGRLRDHAAASAAITVAAARSAGATEDECLEIAACALLHDAAMVWVREEYLAEKGPLPKAGRAAVRRHPLWALRALSDADGLSPAVALWALQVHERPDGSGYPLALRAGEIARPAALLGIVDVFCALLAPRPHRREFGGREAMDLCVRLAGEGQLSGDAVKALLRAVGLYPVGSAVRLSTGEIARVVAASAEAYDRPVVSVVRDPSGLPPPTSRVMDLSELDGISIERAAARDEAPWEGSGGF
ncbi:MAG: HD-GYP domain-containing protein [Planctomycetota bacterium]